MSTYICLYIFINIRILVCMYECFSERGTSKRVRGSEVIVRLQYRWVRAKGGEERGGGLRGGEMVVEVWCICCFQIWSKVDVCVLVLGEIFVIKSILKTT